MRVLSLRNKYKSLSIDLRYYRGVYKMYIKFIQSLNSIYGRLQYRAYQKPRPLAANVVIEYDLIYDQGRPEKNYNTIATIKAPISPGKIQEAAQESFSNFINSEKGDDYNETNGVRYKYLHINFIY